MSASAASGLLDFTALPKDGSVTSGSLGGGVTWSLSATGGSLHLDNGFSVGEIPAIQALEAGLDPAFRLALNNDGVGVAGIGDDDEVTDGGEAIEVSFNKAIKVNGLRFLDLFESGKGIESSISTTLVGGVLIVETFSEGNDGGYVRDNTFGTIAVQGIKFIAGAGQDNNDGDFALAAIEYLAGPDGPSPVPLPAAGLLLAGALGGLGLARRRKKS